MAGFKRRSLYIISGLCIFINVFIAGCSSTNEQDTNVAKQKSSKNSRTSSSSSVAKNLKHQHEANICYEAQVHSHANNIEGHEHSYDCLGIDKAEKITSNAHIHPETRKNKRYRHVHPNGATKHSHHGE